MEARVLMQGVTFPWSYILFCSIDMQFDLHVAAMHRCHALAGCFVVLHFPNCTAFLKYLDDQMCMQHSLDSCGRFYSSHQSAFQLHSACHFCVSYLRKGCACGRSGPAAAASAAVIKRLLNHSADLRMWTCTGTASREQAEAKPSRVERDFVPA